MHFHIITIFPEMFDSYINESILRRAQEKDLVTFSFYNPRDFSEDKHRTTDDTPYGGGPGMVMKAEPILKAVEAALSKIENQKSKIKIVLLSPNGAQFTNKHADDWLVESEDIILIAGRYEGIDARVKLVLNDYNLQPTTYNLISVSEISIGPYTLTGGELPASVIIDVVSRRISGVLGNDESVEERRIASHDVYTKPETIEYKGKEYGVPEVLKSGHHKRIEEWREGK